MGYRKKAAVLLAATAVLVTACSAKDSAGPKESASASTGPSEKVDPFRLPNPVELTTFKSVTPGAKLPEGDTAESNQYSRYIKDKANITVKLLWYASGQDYSQKLNLAVASNDLPDVMVVDEGTFLNLADAGQLEDLTKVFEKYASPLTKELYASTNNKALEKATYKGKLMAIPNISVQADAMSFLWVRKDWLDKLGLQPPKTVDDVTAIAKAFVERDPDGNGKADTIGLTGYDKSFDNGGKASFHNFKGLFEAYNAYPTNWVKDSSGQVGYGSIQPETKQALGKLRDLYTSGLLDKEFAIRKDGNQTVVGGKAGLFFGPWWATGVIADTFTNDPKADLMPYLIQDSKGQKNNLMVPVSNKFIVVKKGVKNPEAAVVYANNFIAAQRKVDPDALKLDFTIDGTYWPIGYATYDYADAVERKSDMLKKAMSGQMKPEELTPEMKDMFDKAMRDKANPRKDVKDWKGYWGYTVPAELLKTNYNKVYSEYTAVTKTMERKWANLQKLETETFFKIVMGEQPLDSFDKFVSDWKAQGGDEITKEVREEISKASSK
ncbi:extracellular solute-binding protein [Paenibacillus aurantius]|uniref:Extracellular solute-binding protein n=1 Tax=Paenibacillus aurantius TaxID=2918900 RepID=A0AA96L994_9BACL|nr:extracellular solute-binding protein [Paenibacillus aurantius]WNQ09045.1 extracellular solute-binding protein [Paenibacillus aurantius]